MASKSLKIDSLDLDLENPRIVQATDQRDAMQKIITEQKAKLVASCLSGCFSRPLAVV
jgi:hypothetical protein